MLIKTMNHYIVVLYATQSTQENLFPMILGGLIPKEKTHEIKSENMSVLHNDVHHTSRYIKILMYSSASASTNNNSFIRRKLPRISGQRWLDLFRRHAKPKSILNFPNLMLRLKFLYHFT